MKKLEENFQILSIKENLIISKKKLLLINVSKSLIDKEILSPDETDKI